MVRQAKTKDGKIKTKINTFLQDRNKPTTVLVMDVLFPDVRQDVVETHSSPRVKYRNPFSQNCCLVVSQFHQSWCKQGYYFPNDLPGRDQLIPLEISLFPCCRLSFIRSQSRAAQGNQGYSHPCSHCVLVTLCL